MIQALVPVDTKHKVSLSVPLIATYLKRGVNYSDIARICNISKQAVSSYIKTHYNDLAPLVDKTDSLAAAQAQHIANKAQERLLLHLSESEKKDLFALKAISGTHIDKYRLLSDKSTQNISIGQVRTNLADLRTRKAVLQARIDKAKGVHV
jgi:predicted transcriptional regulator